MKIQTETVLSSVTDLRMLTIYALLLAGFSSILVSHSRSTRILEQAIHLSHQRMAIPLGLTGDARRR